MSASPAGKPEATHSVVVVDDHPHVCHGLVSLINAEPDFAVCATASSVTEGLQALRVHKPAGLVVDLSLPDGDGTDIIKVIHDEQPDLKILVVSMHEESRVALRALQMGASGFLTKVDAIAHIVQALRQVIAGGSYLSASLRKHLIFQVLFPTDSRRAIPLDKLSDRETEILMLLGRGNTAQQIAELLALSSKTIEAHREHIKVKLSIGSAAELQRFAVDWIAYKSDLSSADPGHHPG